MKKVGALIMRCQPRHRGHDTIIGLAAERCDHLLVLIGSANRPRSVRNPWSYTERWVDLKAVIPSLIGDKEFSLYPVNDYRYSDTQWTSDVEAAVKHLTDNNPSHFSPGAWDTKPILFGHDKPGNGYLKDFPHWQYVNLESDFEACSTELRTKAFNALAYDGRPSTDLISIFGDDTMALWNVLDGDLVEDWRYIDSEKKLFKSYPFPDSLQFNCSDAVVECAGHILLIRRKNSPGKGVWALPGGFKQNNETFLDCAIRELREETNLRVPEKRLRGSIVSYKMYDSPFRGLGIPRNTTAFHFRIDPDPGLTLPRVTPNDDALHAEWVPFSEVLNNRYMHDDHQDIIYDRMNAFPVPAHLSAMYPKYSKTI